MICDNCGSTHIRNVGGILVCFNCSARWKLKLERI